MTPVEKAVIVHHYERGFFSLSLSLFYVFYFSPFSVWGGGKKVSVNRFMCSIHKALYTSSIKQESALYTLGHCAIEGA